MYLSQPFPECLIDGYHTWVRSYLLSFDGLTEMNFEKHCQSFRTFFSKCVCIIDCTEIFIERPSDLKARCQTWSNYKQHNTVKILIAVTPQGTISFISKAWGGRVSDKINILQNTVVY